MAQLDADAVGRAVQKMDEGRAAGMADLFHTGRGLPAAEAAELLITVAERSLSQPFRGAS